MQFMTIVGLGGNLVDLRHDDGSARRKSSIKGF